MRYVLAGTLLLAGALLVGPTDAEPLPPADSALLPVAVTVDAFTRFGEQRVILSGWLRVDRGEPRLEDGREVVDLEISMLRLRGASQLGLISVAERPDDGERYRSGGQLRSLHPGQAFPAAAYFDLYTDIAAPDTPIGPLAFHNETALRLVPRAGGGDAPLTGWPPLGVSFRMASPFEVDDDGDGAVDEDTPDDDGDGLIDEDRPGPDPPTPGLLPECGDDADCDGLDGEDPPAALCAADLCDGDLDGSVDEDPDCVPLFNQANTHLKLGLCVRDVSLDIAPLLLSYSLARAGPSRQHPADILALTPNAGSSAVQAPFVHLSCRSLGLTVDGCDDGADGDQDDLDALSYGSDLSAEGEPELFFSVGTGAQGAPGSAVRAQRDCPPVDPGAAPEPESDVFRSVPGGGNVLVLDGNGPVGACTVAFPLGLVEGPTVRDDVDALDTRDSSAVDSDGDGVPERPVYFSLDTGSPSLASLGFAAADILTTSGGRPPTVFASAAELGLGEGDDLAALCLREDGDGTYGAGDVVYYTLTPRSLSLSSIGAGPGDILAPGSRPVVVQRASLLGLAASDYLDALMCEGLVASTRANGDVSCDGVVNRIDAALVLQYDAGLLAALPCLGNGDISGDRAVNSIDAALVLQIEAGLIGRLPR